MYDDNCSMLLQHCDDRFHRVVTITTVQLTANEYDTVGLIDTRGKSRSLRNFLKEA